MSENINNKETATEKALDIMECPDEITENQLQELLQDEESMQACKDILDSVFLLQAEKGTEAFNIEAELERFKKKHQKPRLYTFWKTATAVAASIALCIGTYYFLNRQTIEIPVPITVFTADNSPQQVILDKGDGEKVILAEHEPSDAVKPKISTKELDYQPQASHVTMQTYTLTIPRGETFKITLCDGTEVWLNANTHFVYPTAFIDKERVVSLNGEAYFKVAHDAEHPFIVETPHIRTRVLGTEFNIRSYTPEDTHIVLINGKVEVGTLQGDTYTSLTPGEDAQLQPDGNFLMTTVDLEQYSYWKDGFFYFDNVALKDIMQDIGRWYNVDIEFYREKDMALKMHFLADRTQAVEHTLKLLNRMKKVNVVKVGNKLVVE